MFTNVSILRYIDENLKSGKSGFQSAAPDAHRVMPSAIPSIAALFCLCRKVQVHYPQLFFQLSEQHMNSFQQTSFKICPMCQKNWISRDEFLNDPTLTFNGYQANFGVLEEGLFYFTHDTETCGSTMTIKAISFLSLYSGKRYKESKQFSNECPGYCSDKNILQRCPAHYQNAFVREVTQIIHDRSPKATQREFQAIPSGK